MDMENTSKKKPKSPSYEDEVEDELVTAKQLEKSDMPKMQVSQRSGLRKGALPADLTVHLMVNNVRAVQELIQAQNDAKSNEALKEAESMTNLNYLQALYKESLHREKALKAENNKLKTPAGPACPLLETIPVEVRAMILGLCLISPILSSIEAIDGCGCQHHGAPTNSVKSDYGLHLQILQVCKKLYDEGRKVLMEENTFILDCCRSDTIRSPLFRKFGSNGMVRYSTTLAKMQQNNNLRSAVKFKIYLAPRMRVFMEPIPDENFLLLCQTICEQPVRDLVVHINKYSQFLAIRPQFSSANFQSSSWLLQPLKLLRGIKTVIVNDNSEEHSDCRNLDHMPNSTTPIPIMDRNAPLPQISLLLRGTSPAPRIFKAYQRLLEYAQSFERCEKFRDDMDASYAICMARKKDDEGNNRLSYLRQNEVSPFKTEDMHPVENRLELARKRADLQDIRGFEKYRKLCLESLDPQYQRIVVAARTIAEFLKWDKTYFPDPSGVEGEIKYKPHNEVLRKKLQQFYGEALYYLDQYEKSFKRDLNRSMEFALPFNASQWEVAYAFLPREIAYKKLKVMVQSNSFTLAEFRKSFLEVVDDMDTQYLAIRRARKEIFSLDIRTTTVLPESYDTVESFTQPWLCDEKINLERDQPHIDIRNGQGPHYDSDAKTEEDTDDDLPPGAYDYHEDSYRKSIADREDDGTGW